VPPVREWRCVAFCSEDFAKWGHRQHFPFFTIKKGELGWSKMMEGMDAKRAVIKNDQMSKKVG
jgi:hypothetical protein